jgi:nitroimidazol reductase NimA-like FMN-containing flavoprotein (pyridoxamine 5'-phosphate oxidase superfamily)
MGSNQVTGGSDQVETGVREAARSALPVTDRTQLRRHAERGRFDRSTVYAIVDEAYVAHVGFVIDGTPHVLPMTYGRISDELYLHGAVGNAMLRAIADAEVCVTITLLDGLVLARSAFHHSMNHRSVVIFGRGQKVDDPAEKRRAFDAIVDHVLPGRAELARPASDAELRTTLVIRVPIEEASAKIRTGGPIDEEADLDLPVWAGVVPVAPVAGPPEQDEAQIVLPAMAALPVPSATRPCP